MSRHLRLIDLGQARAGTVREINRVAIHDVGGDAFEWGDQRHATLQRRPKVYRMVSPAMFRTPSASAANGFGKMSIVVAAPFPTLAT